MQQWTYRQEDRQKWGAGPWDSEPDKKQWVDEVTDLDCLIVRGPLGALCGYVGVAEGHPFFGVDYGACPTACGDAWCEHSPGSRLNAHGGITYSDFCQEEQEHGICHVPGPGRPERVWWLGFDCAHLNGLVPGMREVGARGGSLIGFHRDDVYRDTAYVAEQCALLAKQLVEVAT